MKDLNMFLIDKTATEKLYYLNMHRYSSHINQYSQTGLLIAYTVPNQSIQILGVFTFCRIINDIHIFVKLLV